MGILSVGSATRELVLSFGSLRSELEIDEARAGDCDVRWLYCVEQRQKAFKEKCLVIINACGYTFSEDEDIREVEVCSGELERIKCLPVLYSYYLSHAFFVVVCLLVL